MKKQLVCIFVGAGLLASPAYADRYNRLQPSGSMDQSASLSGGYADGSSRTAEQIARMAAGSVQRTDANQPNGYPQLDANKNITSPLLNNTRVGGSDNGTDVSAALANGVPLKNAINACRQASPNVFYGAVNSSSQMGNAANTAHLLASGNVLPYFNISGIAATVYGAGGDASDVSGPIGISGFKNILKNTGINGVVELSDTKYMTPHVPSKYWQNILTADGLQSINDKKILQDSGFKPTIATFNIRRDVDVGVVSNDDNEYFTANDIGNFQIASRDIMANAPSVKQVWPFIIGDTSHDFATDHYWANARTIIRQAGGVSLDVPAGLYYHNGTTSVQPMIKQIKWANSQGLKTLILLSPYSEETPPGYGSIVYPQWRYDDIFMAHVKNIISWLKAADALPTSWAVVNYSPTQWYNPSDRSLQGAACFKCIKVTANYMGSDNDSANQTIAYVARWVAENAPTSSYTSMPDMGQSVQACASTVLSGYKTTKPVISAEQIGLGSLAYQDYDKATIKYPNLIGAQVSDGMNLLGAVDIGFGFGATNTPAYLGYSKKNSGLTFKNSPVYVDGYNINLINGSSLAVEAGNILITKGGTNGIQFQNTDGLSSSWITGDGQGGINIGSAINVASEMVTFKKSLSLSTHKGASEATLFLDTSGNLVIASLANIQHLAETHFSADKTFSDPDSGMQRDAKFGSKGIAVKGGTKTDTLKVTGLKGKGNAYACLDASGNLYRSATACVSN